jgi:hypothetical protein
MLKTQVVRQIVRYDNQVWSLRLWDERINQQSHLRF